MRNWSTRSRIWRHTEVFGFVIHPRIGLPQGIGWLSRRVIHCMRVAIEEAGRRTGY